MTAVHIGLCFDHRVLFAPRFSRSLAGLDLLLFPELLDGGYAALKRGTRPHRSGDPFLTDFVTTSMTLPACIAAGSVYFQERDRRTNTSFVFQSGRLIHRYDKIHLFGPTADLRYFVPGTTVRPFTLTAGGLRIRAGVVICYDLRFPELTRSLAQQGIRILLVPARWPAVRDDAWRTLLKARAIENQIFVIGCNAHGPEGGASYAFDPLGRLIGSSSAGNTNSLVHFTLDFDAIAESHQLHRNLDDALLLAERPPLQRLTPRRRGRTSLRRSGGGSGRSRPS